MKKETTLLTVTLIAGVILLVTGTIITSLVKTAFADPNSNGNAPPLAPGQNDPHRNPSDGNIQPGQNGGHGSPGQCQKAIDAHDSCHGF